MSRRVDIDQNSDEWMLVRAPLPTASMFSKLLTPAKLQPSKQARLEAYRLAGSVLAGELLEGGFSTEWTQRGHDLEPLAANEYDETSNEPPCTDGGFFIKEIESGEIGASPDRLVGEDGLLEIKCLTHPYHLSAVDKIRTTGTPPHDYLLQCQGQLYVTERKWCDLFFFHPHEKITNARIRIYSDNDIHIKLEAALNSVLEERDRIVKRLT